MQPINISHKFGQEAQFADLNGFLHDIDTVEVTCNDRFEQVIATMGLLPATCFLRRVAVYACKTGPIERFENIEGGEQKCSRTTGGIKHRDLLQLLIEGPRQFN